MMSIFSKHYRKKLIVFAVIFWSAFLIGYVIIPLIATHFYGINTPIGGIVRDIN